MIIGYSRFNLLNLKAQKPIIEYPTIRSVVANMTCGLLGYTHAQLQKRAAGELMQRKMF